MRVGILKHVTRANTVDYDASHWLRGTRTCTSSLVFELHLLLLHSTLDFPSAVWLSAKKVPSHIVAFFWAPPNINQRDRGCLEVGIELLPSW